METLSIQRGQALYYKHWLWEIEYRLNKSHLRLIRAGDLRRESISILQLCEYIDKNEAQPLGKLAVSNLSTRQIISIINLQRRLGEYS